MNKDTSDIQNCTQLVAEMTQHQKDLIVLRVLRQDLMKRIRSYGRDETSPHWNEESFQRLVAKHLGTEKPRHIPSQWH